MSGRPTATKCYSTQTCAYAAWEYAVHCLCVYFFLRFAPVLNSPPKLYRIYATQTRSRRGSGLISVVKIACAHFPPFLLGRVCPVPSSRAHNFLSARAMPILARLSAYNGVSRRSRFTYTFLCPPAKRPTATKKTPPHRMGGDSGG